MEIIDHKNGWQAYINNPLLQGVVVARTFINFRTNWEGIINTYANPTFLADELYEQFQERMPQISDLASFSGSFKKPEDFERFNEEMGDKSLFLSQNPTLKSTYFELISFFEQEIDAKFQEIDPSL